jgi:tRNA modification GTPase
MIHFNSEDTIVALSSSVGKSAIAVVRVSGSNSLNILNQMFSKKFTKKDCRKAVRGNLFWHNNKQLIDQVVVTYFKSPSSYTGEDIVEISCHGNPLIVDQIIEETTRLGARVAQPGEFTKRAFLNHKLDLSQAEAIANLIDSKTRRSLSNSLGQLEGKLSQKILNIKKEILNMLTLIEVSLDFNENDIQIYEKFTIQEKSEKVIGCIQKLIHTFKFGRMLNQGIKMLLLGKPNTGKSTLLNILLEKERAIVSDQPGTTRDYIEGFTQIDGIPIQIIDTAGVRETIDMIEDIGIKKALEHIETSDILIAMFDAHTELDINDRLLINYIIKRENKIPIIIVINKIDLGKNTQTYNELHDLGSDIIEISAKNSLGIQELKKVVKESLTRDFTFEEEDILITNSRHKQALVNTDKSIKIFLKGVKKNLDEVVLATELRNALDHLGQIVGETTTEDVLNNIFNEFCIGK